MQRGELYRVPAVPNDPRPSRVYLVVSRDGFLAARHSTVMVVPVYSASHGLETEVTVDETAGLKHASALHCDEVMSLRRTLLRDYVGSLDESRMREVSRALAIALDIAPEDIEDL